MNNTLTENWWYSLSQPWQNLFKSHLRYVPMAFSPYSRDKPQNQRTYSLMQKEVERIVYDDDITCLLATITELRCFYGGRSFLSDITPLSSFKYIEILELRNNNIEDITPLIHMKNLRLLFLHNNPIKDISVFYHLTKLEYVSFNNPPINDITPALNLTVKYGTSCHYNPCDT
jgi:Leucine-rich repeat (LRR) protein